MYIIEVIPFTKSLRKDSLSYFYSKDIPLGSIVTVDIRKQTVRGLVLSVKEITKEKSELKKLNFTLRKIKGISKNKLYHSAFLKAAGQTANFYAASTGSVIGAFTPSPILNDIEKIKAPKELQKNNITNPTRKFLIQSDISERYSNYKNLIRGEFAKKKSVIFVCPTVEDTLYAQGMLSKGIEDHAFVLNSNLTKKQILDTWNKIIANEKPTLSIVTAVFVGIPRHDIGFIVVERESFASYRTQKRPYLDVRYFIEEYAKNLGVKFLLGDIMLRSEILWRFGEHQFDALSSLKFRSISSTEQRIIDMKKDKHNAGEIFQVLSNEVRSLIKSAKEKNQQTFLFGARKGLSPTILCQDCGTVVSCDQCSAPMVLHGRDATEKGNFFKCHICGNERNAGERCKLCDSWKLNTLGIGIRTIEAEIKKEFPEQKMFILDGDNAKTHKQAKIIIDSFYSTPGSILLGTEMALLYLHEPIENAVVVTIDSLFSIPDFAIRERMMRTLLRIKASATHTFYIQTRRAEDSIFDFAIRGNLSDFYREEFKSRKQFNYPPFSLLIKLSIAGKRYLVEKEMEKLVEFFKPHNLLIYPAFIQEQKGKFIINGLIRLNKDEWINADLLEKLKSLPPYYKIVVGSESLL